MLEIALTLSQFMVQNFSHIMGSWQLLVISLGGRQRAEGRRQKGGKKEGGRDRIELLTSNFTPSNFWYGIAIPPVT